MRLIRRRPGSAESSLTRLRNQIDDIFDPEVGFGHAFGGWNPAVDVFEDKDKLTVKAELPGSQRDDHNVSLAENNLLLSRERRYEGEQKESKFYRPQRVYGTS